MEPSTIKPQLQADFPRSLQLLGLQQMAVEEDHSNRKSDETIFTHQSATQQEKADSSVPSEADSKPITTRKEHIIKDGDTLPQIAQEYCGDVSRAQEIYELNRDRLPDFDVLPIGIEISLPVIEHAP